MKNRLKASEVAQYREDLLNKQGGLCAICGEPILEKAVLDHAHYEPSKGKCRGTLHNHCNIFLGKLENSRIRTGTSWEAFKAFTPNCYVYIFRDYIDMMYHPKHLNTLVSEFRALGADQQREVLDKYDIPEKKKPLLKNQKGRVKLFRSVC